MRVRLSFLVALLVTPALFGDCGTPEHPCRPQGYEAFFYSDAGKTDLIGYAYSGCPNPCSCGWDSGYSWGATSSEYSTWNCFECDGCGSFCGGCPMNARTDGRSAPSPLLQDLPRVVKRASVANRCILP
jgi:hypothetical protein